MLWYKSISFLDSVHVVWHQVLFCSVLDLIVHPHFPQLASAAAARRLWGVEGNSALLDLGKKVPEL